ncbi:MAG: 5'/3'-nucleotidase SurE [Candidatus Eisenbacteria bacterium]|nr:5'/3'-nucleotidase SurE [Candidatus Eisenbacteria bacterium]
MVILVTNDDGVHAAGLSALREALSSVGKVVVIAPDREQSATSHSLTLEHPLRVRHIEESFMSVDGTPTDCVLLAFNGLLQEKPQMVVAGINHGPNLGEDVSYSGTVAAAIEGTLQGAPSVAVSLAGKAPYDFEAACSFTVKLVRTIEERGMESQALLNVNVPNLPPADVRGVKVTRLGRRVYRDMIVRKTDPRGKSYYWIGGNEPTYMASAENTDFNAVKSRMISVTPMHLDFTDYKKIVEMESWDLKP